jgi:Family of unknown function (DUF6496)
MPEDKVIERARRDAAEGKSPSTQAGEFVREEIEHVRQGKHGARSPQQAIAIGLSKARRAGVKLPPPKAGRSSKKVQDQARRERTSPGGPAAVRTKGREGLRRAARKAAQTRRRG